MTFESLNDVEKEYWLNKATDHLLRHGRIPMTDDVWATDKYSDLISEHANEMWIKTETPTEQEWSNAIR
jgi:hypothetical protein